MSVICYLIQVGQLTRLGVTVVRGNFVILDLFFQIARGNLLLSEKNADGEKREQIGWNVPRKYKVNFLVKTLLYLSDSKEAVYGALDGWVAWEEDFPFGKIRMAKGQGNTVGTYGQLIRLCKSLIAIYYRNNMLTNLVKLFEGLEAFDGKPPEKSIVRRVADAYEMLGRLEDKERVLQKYNYLLTDNVVLKKSRMALSKNKKKLG
ncbi:pentatricopeptide repeat-containing protein [Pyrus ussuriensis x Pyrus communis]|uniref:Pentatricopeptide repeat-containing protein n=1 Tax=Pyrus ussuriensis x Pyrus communis TaxID=2448454 RepID=A0A5N5H8I7_9ROSA|nr:pentatricopeptide repeat-containing protein [Pyrus ussuriensis x Pyrus communis]